MASDGQLTSGMVRSTGKKIKKFNDYCLWSAAGELALIQRVEEGMQGGQKDKPLADARDSLAEIVRNSVSALLQLDFRTPFAQGNPDVLLQLHQGDFVFAEYRQKRPRILHIIQNGTPEWIDDRPFASGTGDLFAYALLQRYQSVICGLSVEQTSLLAFGVIREAIEVGAYGLGPPIDVWQITQQGHEKLPDEQIASLEDAVDTLRYAEMELFSQTTQEENQS